MTLTPVVAKGRPIPRPFVKWAGGKRQLITALVARVEAAGRFRRYHEPFLGGGALFFELHRRRMIPGGAALSDTNLNLIEAWLAVRDAADELVERLGEHARRHSPEHFYAVRSEVPNTATARAARVIYLNKTCFNGLFRENSRGEFNVPLGRMTNPAILDEANLRACSAALSGVDLRCEPFAAAVARARRDDLIYFDPPYVPVSKTSVFTEYARGGFGEDEQARLAAAFAELGPRGVKAILSNSWTPFVRKHYRAFAPTRVSANRNLNSNKDRRGPVGEALLDNFRPRRAVAAREAR